MFRRFMGRTMKNLYNRCFKMFAAATLLCIFLRVLLKTLFVDIETGFYLGGAPLVYGFAAIEILTAALLLLFAWRTRDSETGELRGNRPLEMATAACGALIAACSVPKLKEALALGFDQPAINRLPTNIMVLENILGIAAGIIIIYIAFCFFSGAATSSLQGILALVPVLWQTVYMVERYISFRQVNTVSDQLLETMYLVFATLFLLYSSRYVAHNAKGRRRCIACGLLAAHFGLVTASGQLAAVMVLGDKVVGPPMTAITIMLGISLYAVAVSASLALCVEKK